MARILGPITHDSRLGHYDVTTLSKGMDRHILRLRLIAMA